MNTNTNDRYTTGARILHIGALLVLFAASAYMPYKVFGVVPFIGPAEQEVVDTAAQAPVAEAAREITPPTGQTADLLILNGHVYTADQPGTIAQAVAIVGNTILRVGSNTALSALRGPATRVVDARGGTVAPGFNDSHVHFLDGGLALGDVDLAGLTTLSAVQNKIRAFAAAKPQNAWVIGQGWLYAAFPGGTPTKEQLDAVIADRPAAVRGGPVSRHHRCTEACRFRPRRRLAHINGAASCPRSQWKPVAARRRAAHARQHGPASGTWGNPCGFRPGIRPRGAARSGA